MEEMVEALTRAQKGMPMQKEKCLSMPTVSTSLTPKGHVGHSLLLPLLLLSSSCLPQEGKAREGVGVGWWVAEGNKVSSRQEKCLSALF